jgi:hypothetical protein
MEMLVIDPAQWPDAIAAARGPGGDRAGHHDSAVGGDSARFARSITIWC